VGCFGALAVELNLLSFYKIHKKLQIGARF
jgi:hypothetical protein